MKYKWKFAPYFIFQQERKYYVFWKMKQWLTYQLVYISHINDWILFWMEMFSLHYRIRRSNIRDLYQNLSLHNFSNKIQWFLRLHKNVFVSSDVKLFFSWVHFGILLWWYDVLHCNKNTRCMNKTKKSIHKNSKNKPWIKKNCEKIPSNLDT